MSMREAWERHARDWVRWAREPGHDSYWQFHGERFLEIVPPPGRLTLDIGCGEGRLGRDLARRGHRVISLDASPTLARHAAEHEEGQPVLNADAAALPVRSGVADLAIAFMSLQDIDDPTAAINETARAISEGGRVCVSIVHPLNSAGKFRGDRDDRSAPFVITESYMEERQTVEEVKRGGLEMSFHSAHRPLESYTRALEDARLRIEMLREIAYDDPSDRWHRIPLFLHLRAVKQRR